MKPNCLCRHQSKTVPQAVPQCTPDTQPFLSAGAWEPFEDSKTIDVACQNNPCTQSYHILALDPMSKLSLLSSRSHQGL